MEDLENILKNSNQKCLVSLMHINNEIGNITDIDAVSKICKKYNSLFQIIQPMPIMCRINKSER